MIAVRSLFHGGNAPHTDPRPQQSCCSNHSLSKKILVKSRFQSIPMATVAVLFLLQVATAQMAMQPQPFSADVQVSSTHDGRMTRDMTGRVYCGSGHMRTEVQGEGGSRGGTIMITDFKTRTTDILMPEQHIYLEQMAGAMLGNRPGMMPDVKPLLRDPSNPCAGEEGTTCKNLGVEEVNGRACDHRQITEESGKVANVWIDQKLHFPIKVVSGEWTWTLTNIKEGEPDASLFQIPPGYTKMEKGSMMQMGRPPQQ